MSQYCAAPCQNLRASVDNIDTLDTLNALDTMDAVNSLCLTTRSSVYKSCYERGTGDRQ